MFKSQTSSFFLPCRPGASAGFGFSPCLTRCQAAALIQLIPPSLPQTGVNPLGGACIFAHFFQKFFSTCPAGNNKYGIAFANGNNQVDPFNWCPAFFSQRGSVDLGTSTFPGSYAPGLLKAFSPQVSKIRKGMLIKL